MAALGSITAVRSTSNTVTRNVIYGATVAAGQPLYLDISDGEWKLADANASVTTADAKGIAITPGVDAGYGLVAVNGSIILVGTTMAVGETYYVGGTAGTIVPDADLTTSDWVTRLGTAATATQIDLSIEATAIVHA